MQGFIPGSRGSFMLDFVVVAMVFAVPMLIFGIGKAKAKQFATHKRIMLVLSAVLITAVCAFEIEMRLVGWQHLAESSPYWSVLEEILWVHIIISVSTTICLVATVVFALRKFSSPLRPGSHSSFHRKIGKATKAGLILTAVTGWIFYWMAFVAV